MTALVIRSEDDAYVWLEQYLAGEATADGLVLEGWPKLTVRLVGDKFDQSLTPSVMKGLIELQAAVNRSFALSKYGVPDPRKLSKEERDQLELEIKVEKGSTLLEIDFQELLTSIATQAVGKMDPTTIAGTVIGLGVIWAGSTAFKSWLEHRKEIRKEEVKSESDREHLDAMKFMSAEETKRVEILAGLIQKQPELDNADRYAHDARSDLLKSFSRADTAEIDGVELDADTARQLVANARRKSEEVRLDGRYKLLRNDASDLTAFKVRVWNKETGQVIDALVQDDTLTQQYKTILREAEWDRSLVDLRINAKSLDGSIRNAVIIGVKRVEEEAE
ncbi:hypothetical protein ACET32_20830 [Pseudomonas aeruginosa]